MADETLGHLSVVSERKTYCQLVGEPTADQRRKKFRNENECRVGSSLFGQNGILRESHPGLRRARRTCFGRAVSASSRTEMCKSKTESTRPLTVKPSPETSECDQFLHACREKLPSTF